MIPRLMLFIIFTVLVAASLSSFASTIPSVGTMAPDFTLESQEGKAVSLSQYRGMWVVLYFYPKDFTSGCTMEAHNFQRDEAQYEKKRAVVLGVSVDSSDSHQQFCSKEGLSFKLLADTEHKVSRMYGSLNNLGRFKFAARHTFIINPEGKIQKVFTEVDLKQHSQKVLVALARPPGAWFRLRAGFPRYSCSNVVASLQAFRGDACCQTYSSGTHERETYLNSY